jgi:ubiquinone/menaquinone biosynthesis C-methylase UbiE
MGMTSASAGYFDRVADQWDTLRSGYFQESVREAAIAKAYLRPEMVVADVGTGTGFVAAGLAPVVSRVYALDGSPAMLDVARRNLATFANVTYRVSDGSALALDDASVDAAFANMYLHHCADPAAAIREMVRVLKPGGRLVITDMDQHDHEWMRQEMADEWLGFDRSQIRAWFREAGLVNILVDCTSQSCCATSTTEEAAKVEISVFVASGSRRVVGTREAVQANYGALAGAVAEGQGCGCSAGAVPASAYCGCSGEATSTTTCCAAGNAMDQIELTEGDGGMAWVTGYTQEQLGAVPAEAVNLSLGCGNPTALASLKPGEVVLDIGSGAGIDAFYAAKRVGTSGKVIGLDMTPSMIERARRSAEEAGIGQVEFRLGNAEAMPIEAGTVDVVLSNCVINLCEDKGKVFEEAYRVLRDGGRLSISDMVSDQPFPMSWRSDPVRWAGCVNGALPEQEYLDLVKHAGFTDVKATRSLSGGTVEGVQVYSLSVSARKGQAAATGGCAGGVTDAAPMDVIRLNAAPSTQGGCCGGGCCG